MAPRTAAILIALAATAAYVSVPVLHRSVDTDPQLYTSASWISQGDASIDEYPRGLSSEIVVNGHAYSSYPVGLGVVAAPALAPFVIAGAAVTDIAFRAVFGRLLALVLTAASAGFIYLASARIARPAAAFVATVGYAFGTSTWAISSQELTQHAVAQLWIAIAAYLLARGGAAAPRAGLALSLATLTRPLILILGLAGALSARRIGGKAALLRYVSWSLPPAPFLIVYSFPTFGSPGGVLYAHY